VLKSSPGTCPISAEKIAPHFCDLSKALAMMRLWVSPGHGTSAAKMARFLACLKTMKTHYYYIALNENQTKLVYT
jgi:hypothetical protein